jgi:hypothetical protein
MKTVFSDAALRQRWRNYESEIDLSKIFVTSLSDILSSFKKILDFKVTDLPSAHQGKWFDNLRKILELRPTIQKDMTDFLCFLSVVKDINFRIVPNANELPSCNVFFKLLKEFRDDFIKKYFDAIEADVSGDQEIRNSWDQNLRQLFKQVDSELCKDNSITFADLEFYSHLL